MARGISIGDVENKVQHISDNNVIPLSTGADVPEVVTVGVLKEHINEDVDTALEGKQDVINDLASIRSGAALGATALQSFTETDPTVPSWAKAGQKPSYTASEVGAVPTTRKINNKALSSDITLTAADVNALPSSTVIPTAQIQSDWNQSNTSAKDYIKNKPTIPTVPTNVSAFTNDAGYLTEHQDISGKANSDDLATVAFSGDYEDLTNTPTIPDVPEWAMASTKPSYTVSEIDGAQEELVSGTNIKTINGESILGSGNITIQGGGSGDVNVIETVKVNGRALVPDANKAVDITVPDVSGKIDKVSNPTNGNFASLDSNGNLVDSGHKHSDYLTSHQDLSNYVQKSQTSGLLKNDGSVDTNTYLTQHQDISDKENTSNKVTSLSSSSTDTQYPSAKATYTYINAMLGDIETLLSNI